TSGRPVMVTRLFDGRPSATTPENYHSNSLSYHRKILCSGSDTSSSTWNENLIQF
ncbi:hypothetical protein J6590_101928, partial [Homalodisca vitripennis]